MYGKLDSTGDYCFRGCNAWFDSGYSLCEYFGRISHIFYDAADSDPEVLLSFFRTVKRAQSMLLVAVLLCAARTWKPGSPFYELHVAEMRDEGQHFWGTCVTPDVALVL